MFAPLRPAARALASTLIIGACACALASCESTDPPKKKRPLLPGEEISDLNWNRPTGPNDVSTPMGLPMSR